MSAPFRIYPKSDFRSSNDAFKDYLSRLLKLIPGEIVGLYMVGSGFIPTDQHQWVAAWPIVCLVLLLMSRYYGTRDPVENLAAQPAPIFLSCLAFVVWVYWLGGPFTAYGLHKDFLGSLLVLVISFIAPIFYPGC